MQALSALPRGSRGPRSYLKTHTPVVTKVPACAMGAHSVPHHPLGSKDWHIKGGPHSCSHWVWPMVSLCVPGPQGRGAPQGSESRLASLPCVFSSYLACVLHTHPPHPMPAPPNSIPTPAANEPPRLPWVLAQAQVWGPLCGCRPLHLCKACGSLSSWFPAELLFSPSLLALSSAPCTPGPRQKALFVPVLFQRTSLSPFLSSQSLLPGSPLSHGRGFFPSWPVSMGPGQSEDSEKSRGFVSWTETDKRACVCSIQPRANVGSGGHFGGHQPPIRQFPHTALGRSAGQLPDFPETTAPPPTTGGDLC